MEVRTKALFTFLVVGAFVGIYIWQGQSGGLFKGELIKRSSKPPAENTEAVNQLPDLTADLVVVAPEQQDGDVSVKVTITNNGPGTIDGKKPFKYSVYMNNTEVFSNTDSYTTMAAADSFSFTYPISRAVYQYSDTGSAKIVIDGDNAIEEGDEENNEKTVEYSIQ